MDKNIVKGHILRKFINQIKKTKTTPNIYKKNTYQENI